MPLTRFAGVVLLAILLPYLAPPVYRFAPPRPFSGPELWNPYAQASGRWRRANFHAHGTSWGGITNGAQADEEVLAAYRAAGYDIATVSDYQRISPADDIPVYEHGYNIAKHHQLPIGAHDVVWTDFPFWQGINEKQYVLDLLRPSTDLISINHPSRLHSYTTDDVRQLTGYELMEIANGRVTTEDRWDAALSTGHVVWGLGGDDTHDVTDTQRMAVAWTMIDAPSTSRADVIAALRAGRAYVVVRTAAEPTAGDVTLSNLSVADNRIAVTLTGAPSTITFVGQDGRERQKTTGTSATYAFTAADTYIRTFVHSPKTDLFLNAVVRTSGGQPQVPAPIVNTFWTATRRIGIVVIGGSVAALALRRRRRR